MSRLPPQNLKSIDVPSCAFQKGVIHVCYSAVNFQLSAAFQGATEMHLKGCVGSQEQFLHKGRAYEVQKDNQLSRMNSS